MTARQVQPSMLPDHAPDKPTGRIVGSVINGTNADLIHAIAPLYLTGSVLDVTYGEGGWWRRFKPEPFTAHDLYTLDGVDFRALPEADASVDTVCFDPPYVAAGGEATSPTVAASFRDAFGLVPCRGRSGVLDLFHGGLTESARVARQWILVKCMDAVDSAEFWLGHIAMIDIAREIGLGDPWDLIVHHTGSGPGGHNIFDVKRARRHHSYLLVFAKGGAL
jgi:hypothetical protein